MYVCYLYYLSKPEQWIVSFVLDKVCSILTNFCVLLNLAKHLIYTFLKFFGVGFQGRFLLKFSSKIVLNLTFPIRSFTVKENHIRRAVYEILSYRHTEIQKLLNLQSLHIRSIGFVPFLSQQTKLNLQAYLFVLLVYITIFSKAQKTKVFKSSVVEIMSVCLYV